MEIQELMGRRFLLEIDGKEHTGKIIDFEHSREPGYTASVWVVLDDGLRSHKLRFLTAKADRQRSKCKEATFRA